MAGKNMREVDTETPVIWPSWCYTGEATIDDSTHTALSAHQRHQLSSTLPSSLVANKNKGKRKGGGVAGATAGNLFINNQLDKMLSDRMMNIADNKKFCDSPTTGNIFYEKSKCATDIGMEYIKSNGDLTVVNNNNTIKSERLSPTTTQHNGNAGAAIIGGSGGGGDPLPLTNSSRSRSGTPSSFPGTPPQQQQQQQQHHQQPHHLHQQQQHHQSNESINHNSSAAAAAGAGSVGSSSMKPDFPPRNYSDFIRSLAAKYNNGNPNEPNNARNMLYESRFALGSTQKNTKDSPSPPECKRLPPTPPQVANQNSLMSSIFQGIPFPSTVFSPLIDMSSTQALVTLARAAKEAELQSLLKGSSTAPPSKRPNTDNLSNPNPSSMHSLQMPRYPAPQSFSAALNLNAAAAAAATAAHNAAAQSPSSQTSDRQLSPSHHQHTTGAQGGGGGPSMSSPLDLSSTPVTKRLKLESPSPSRSIGSPTSSAGHHNQRDSRSHSSCKNSSSGHQQPQNIRVKCHAQIDEINGWNVSQVCDFVGNIDICAEYVENFREQSIDGSGLPMLTEDHLMNSLGMKLGPALKLRSVLAKRLGAPCSCVACTLSMNATSPAGSLPRPSSVDSET